MADGQIDSQLRVRELCALVDDAITAAFPHEVWVQGSISGLNRSAKGHVYFDLVETNELGQPGAASIPVALFANAKQRVNAILRRTNTIRMHDGVEIKIRGAVQFYERQGRVQLIMSLIDPSFTLGQIEQARAQLLAGLAAEGLLGANGELEWPVLPLRIALVTSSGSAAEADVVHQLTATGRPFDITVFDCRVQGDDAPAEIAAAITDAGSAGSATFDLVAVVRGGGARTDLVAFDHERVARAIATCPLPVVVGVGHETDHSVADDVAHSFAKTPTACADLIIDGVAKFEHRVSSASRRIASAAMQHLARADILLAGHRTTLARSANDTLTTSGSQLDLIEHRLAHAATLGLERAEARLEQHDVRLRALDPAVALARGWSITHRSDGSLVRSPNELETGDTVVTTLAGGSVTSTVTETENT